MRTIELPAEILLEIAEIISIENEFKCEIDLDLFNLCLTCKSNYSLLYSKVFRKKIHIGTEEKFYSFLNYLKEAKRKGKGDLIKGSDLRIVEYHNKIRYRDESDDYTLGSLLKAFPNVETLKLEFKESIQPSITATRIPISNCLRSLTYVASSKGTLSLRVFNSIVSRSPNLNELSLNLNSIDFNRNPFLTISIQPILICSPLRKLTILASTTLNYDLFNKTKFPLVPFNSLIGSLEFLSIQTTQSDLNKLIDLTGFSIKSLSTSFTPSPVYTYGYGSTFSLPLPANTFNFNLFSQLPSLDEFNINSHDSTNLILPPNNILNILPESLIKLNGFKISHSHLLVQSNSNSNSNQLLRKCNLESFNFINLQSESYMFLPNSIQVINERSIKFNQLIEIQKVLLDLRQRENTQDSSTTRTLERVIESKSKLYKIRIHGSVEEIPIYEDKELKELVKKFLQVGVLLEFKI